MIHNAEQEDVDRMVVEKEGESLPVYTGGYTCDVQRRLRSGILHWNPQHDCIIHSAVSFKPEKRAAHCEMFIASGADAPDRKSKRIRVVVLGSGWAAMSFVKVSAWSLTQSVQASTPMPSHTCCE